MLRAGNGELPGGRVDRRHQGYVCWRLLQCGTQGGTNLLIGVALAEQPLRSVAQALQVQVQAVNAAATNLHGGEMRIAGESQRREVVGAGRLGIALGDVGMDGG